MVHRYPAAPITNVTRMGGSSVFTAPADRYRAVLSSTCERRKVPHHTRTWRRAASGGPPNVIRMLRMMRNGLTRFTKGTNQHPAAHPGVTPVYRPQALSCRTTRCSHNKNKRGVPGLLRSRPVALIPLLRASKTSHVLRLSKAPGTRMTQRLRRRFPAAKAAERRRNSTARLARPAEEGSAAAILRAHSRQSPWLLTQSAQAYRPQRLHDFTATCAGC